MTKNADAMQKGESKGPRIYPRGPYFCSSLVVGILWQERILKRETADLRIVCSRFVKYSGIIVDNPCIITLRTG
jgi:hypothetical protein